MMKRLLAAVLLVSCGGVRAPVTVTVPAPPIATTAVRRDASPNPRLWAELPPLDGDTTLVSERRLGFSRDDAYLGWAISTCDPCPLEFHFESATRRTLDFAYRWDPGDDGQLSAERAEAIQNEVKAKVDGTLEELGVEEAKNGRELRGPFPYPDLVFAATQTRNDAKGTVTLHFGARVVGHPPIFTIHLELGPHPIWPHGSMHEATLAYANVTHDGSELGVVAIASGDMWFEQARLARVRTRKLVGQVYNDTAMALHLRGRYADAAKLFAEAEDANPDESLFSYNLACAYARSGDSRTKDALARAIRKGGAAIQARALADQDFASVRDAPWFRAAVSGAR